MKIKGLTVSCLECAEKRIMKTISNSNLDDGGNIEKRIADNAYVFLQSFAVLKKEKRFIKAIERKRRSNLFFITLWKGLKKNSFSLSKAVLSEMLSKLNLCIEEIDLLKSMVTVCCIVEVGLVCKTTSQNSDGTERINKVLATLRQLDHFDFDSLYSVLSPAVAVIEKNEPHFSKMTKETKAQYRIALKHFAGRMKLNELDAAFFALQAAKKQGVLIGEILEVDKSPNRSTLYVCLTLVLFSVLLGGAYYLCGYELIALLLAVPFAFLAFSSSDFLFSVFGKVAPCPALKIDDVPYNGRTLTVITSLLSGTPSDEQLFQRIERFFILNDKPGIYYGLLCDLPDADRKRRAKDKEIVDFVIKKTKELRQKSDGRFTLFLRDREINLDGIYGGKERKRGAVEALINLLNGKENRFSLIEGEVPKDISFLLTLDSDTNLSLDSVSELIGVMLHPLNRPKIENNRVTKGYGIIQPSIKTSLESLNHSRFSATVGAVGGIDIYERAGFERHQQVFGEGIFCGKGMIDVKLYDKLLSGRLPENKILSHDMPEGNILRTRYVGEVSFTDSTPKNLIAYYDRLHRWIRGDVQNLVLVNGYGQGKRGALRIVVNVFRHLSPVFSLLVFCLSAVFLGGKNGVSVCLFALLPMLSPIVFTFLSRPLGIKFRLRRFFSAVTNGLIQSFKSSAHEVLALAYKCQITLDAVCRSIYRMSVGQKLLVWRTASDVDRTTKEKTVYFIYRSLLSSMFGAVLFFFSNLWISRLLGLLWFLFPLYAKFVSSPIPSSKGFNEKQKKKLYEYSSAMWRYFSENTSGKTANLPPDNIQFAPTEAVAMRTSPTNIGLYLTSCLAAKDFGFINAGELNLRVSSCLETVKKLQKWHGHLYNWYSLPDLEVLGGAYVSTVDSGNFCVCLLALAEGLEEYGLKALSEEVRRLCFGADFTVLYDNDRDLFSLGYDSETNSLSKICYDLYMSEARSGSFFALAFGQVPKEHFKKLRRPVISSGGYIGMASWSGTAFEYFMPQLFLPLYKNSFVDESLRFAYSQQKRFAFDGVFGTSESGYYRFDSEMNYQYKAHGISSLSLMRQNKDEIVLSPYSLFLFLCVAKNGPLKALENFESMGAYGEYGFYEAVDLTPFRSGDGALIQSYMSHHVGMSLLACANAVFDNVFVNRFMKHPKTSALYELFQEQIPINARLFEAPEKVYALSNRRVSFNERLTAVEPSSPVTSVIGRGKSSVWVGSPGHVSFRYGDICVNETIFDCFDVSKTFGVCFYDGNSLYNSVYDADQGGCFSFESTDNYVAHICSSANFSGRVKYCLSKDGAFIIESKAESNKSFSMFYSFDLQMAENKEFYSHSSFSRLFVTASFVDNENALVYRKGARDGKSAVYLAVGFSDKNVAFDFETSNDCFDAFSVSKPVDRFAEIYRNKTGVCVNPCCVIRTVPLAGGEAKLILSCGKSENEALARLNRARLDSRASKGLSLVSENESRLLTALFYGKVQEKADNSVTLSELWRHGVSGDFPLVSVAVREFNDQDISFYVKTFKRLRSLGLKTELCFLIADSEKYSRPLENAVRTVVSRLEAEDFVNKRCGIFFIQRNTKTDSVFKALSDWYTEVYDGLFDCVEDNGFIVSPFKPINKPQPCSITLESGLKNNIFTVDKAENLKTPFSYVLTGKRFGSVVTHANLGYTFFIDASGSKLCSFYGDPYKSGNEGERLIYHGKDGCYDLVSCSAYVSYGDGLVVYRGQIEGRLYTVTVYVCEKFPFKVFEVCFDDGEKSEVSFEIIPSLSGGLPARKGIFNCVKNCGETKAVLFKNCGTHNANNLCGFCGKIGGSEIAERKTLGKVCYSVRGFETSHFFFLGATVSEFSCEQVIKRINLSFLQAQKENAVRFARSMLSPIQVESSNSLMDSLINSLVLHQVGACRFYARGSFYQSGGAYGFRDQLQDCLALIYTSPREVRTHLIRAASRQYVEGDVQHWWNSFDRAKGFKGLRTKCSDDLLWLPYCVSDYVEKTGDLGVLNTEIFYLCSSPLLNEKERYERAERSEVKESLYCHCLRAFERAYNLGQHGLPMMGSCDWNDAFSDMGEGSESVFVAWWYVVAAEKFLPICRLFGDAEAETVLKKRIVQLRADAESCFNKDRYARAYFADGKVLGNDESDACKIDLLTQAFASFAGGNKSNVKVALSTAYTALFSEDTKIMRLFMPPFSDSTTKVGYINGYACGIRENGGQYTHGALWFADACLKNGMLKEGFSILDGSNPLWRSSNINLTYAYKTEPYAICADIYDGVGQRGRGGWSWYTGAAAWYYKIVIETVLGLKLSGGFKLFEAKPLIEFKCCLKFGGVKLKVNVSKAFQKTKLDNKETDFPVCLTDGEHELELPLE